ncbi:MAG: histidine kinase dimerization/phosphoacceptor domain -containing protein [Rhizomicrobium sp.]
MNWFRFGRAQTAIYALATFALVATAAWRAESLYGERGRLIKISRLQAATLALGTATYVDRTIDVAELLSDDVRQHIAQRGGLRSITLPDLRSYIAGKVNETTMRDYLTIVDNSGNPLVLSDRVTPPNINLSDRDWFKAIQRGAENYIGPAVVSRLGRNIVYTYTKKLDPIGGEPDGVVDVAIRSQAVKKPSDRLTGEPQTQVWTTDGRMILASFMTFDPHGNAALPRAPFAKAPAQGAGFLKSPGGDLIVAYQRTGGLIATVTFSRREILAPWQRRVWLSVALLILLTAITALLVWFAASLVARDVKARGEMEKSAGALAMAVAQRDTLLKEIHHRVKNNLQVTSSLIDMQARQFEDEAVRVAFKRMQQRLHAIGMVHDVLYGEQGVSIIDMRDYLTRLCQEVARANGTSERKIDMALDIAPIVLAAEQATSLGLCASEVLVNAFKHAFPETGGGEIAVRLYEIAGQVELIIHDNGFGIAPPEGGKSLGMRLIRAFASQLGGSFAFESEGGTTFRLNFTRARAGQ